MTSWQVQNDVLMDGNDSPPLVSTRTEAVTLIVQESLPTSHNGLVPVLAVEEVRSETFAGRLRGRWEAALAFGGAARMILCDHHPVKYSLTMKSMTKESARPLAIPCYLICSSLLTTYH